MGIARKINTSYDVDAGQQKLKWGENGSANVNETAIDPKGEFCHLGIVIAGDGKNSNSLKRRIAQAKIRAETLPCSELSHGLSEGIKYLKFSFQTMQAAHTRNKRNKVIITGYLLGNVQYIIKGSNDVFLVPRTFTIIKY